MLVCYLPSPTKSQDKEPALIHLDEEQCLEVLSRLRFRERNLTPGPSKVAAQVSRASRVDQTPLTGVNGVPNALGFCKE